MKRLFSLLILVAIPFAGCEYTEPIASGTNINIDSHILGLWEAQDKDESVRLLILKLNDKEYLIQYSVDMKESFYFKAILVDVGGTIFVQMQLIGTNEGNASTDERKYSFAIYNLEKDKLHIRLLNPDVVSTNIKTSSALVNAIQVNRNNPRLFRSMGVFRRTADTEKKGVGDRVR